MFFCLATGQCSKHCKANADFIFVRVEAHRSVIADSSFSLFVFVCSSVRKSAVLLRFLAVLCEFSQFLKF
jgi:hypothetical protein